MKRTDDRRLLAGLICAAIWLIALQFGAVPAHAHPGHAHKATPVVAAASTRPVAIEPTVLVEGAETSAVAGAPTEPRPASEAPSGRAIAGVQSSRTIADVPSEPAGKGAVPNGTCNGACCGAAVCCGTALPVAPPAHAPPHLLAQRVFRPESPAISGVEPGRLPEPPRSFA